MPEPYPLTAPEEKLEQNTDNEEGEGEGEEDEEN